MNLQSWITIGVIFVLVVLRQLGTKKYTGKSIIISVALMAYFGYTYIKMPTDTQEVKWIIGLAILGVIFGLVMLKTMKFSNKNGENYVTTGIGYMIIWIIGLGWKIVLAEYMQHINPVGSYEFMMKHGLGLNSIGTMFMAFTIAMIAVKVIGTLVIFNVKKINNLNAVQA